MTPIEILALGPLKADWNEGPLPPVETVPYDQLVLVWTTDYVGFAQPDGDTLNPLKWVDQSRFPRWGRESPSGWWVVLRPGSMPRPPKVQTWDEMFGGAP